MINFHPELAHLRAFAEGTCPTNLALMISAHVDLCPRCQAITMQAQEEAGLEVFSGRLNAADPQPDFNDMMLQIMQTPDVQAPVDLGQDGQANFIYMEKGGRVPEHTHKGTEFTLVIDGQFSDGLADYDCGDFTIMDSTKKHMPFSEADEGCLVFTMVDKPLHFTSGLARLLNPFSQLFFK